MYEQLIHVDFILSFSLQTDTSSLPACWGRKEENQYG